MNRTDASAPRLLAIETSSEACSVALSLGGELRERFEHAPLRHAELLLPAVQALLAEADCALTGLDAIAFGRGPGSFTSLRIGIGVVQGLAWAAELPVVPVSSLAAVAQEALQGAEGAAGLPVLVAADARMDEVFAALFEAGHDGVVQAVGGERVCGPAAAAALRPAGPFIAAGNGFERYAPLQELGVEAAYCAAGLWPRAAVVAQLAAHWLRTHRALPAAQAQPVYLRDNVAEKPAAR
jgi:tRNA threonylcarbamoyladenosine biosynthesis protein TsaB